MIIEKEEGEVRIEVGETVAMIEVGGNIGDEKYKTGR